MPIFKNGHAITSLLDWQTHAGPKSNSHWVDGRSAKEVARAWLDSGIHLPPEVSDALIPSFVAITWEAEPEAKLRFDHFPGEPRNSDLAVHVKSAKGDYLIAIEAKTVTQTIKAAAARHKANPRSKGLDRVHQLLEAILGATGKTTAHDGLRYQLLTASAGALCEAKRKGYSRAVLLIHEFFTSKTKKANHERNQKDLLNFINALEPGWASGMKPGKILGPFKVPGGKLLTRPPEFYIGKVICDLR
jgi:hypothetical protein